MGADSSVRAKIYWPQAWPLQPASTHLQGVGTAVAPECNTQLHKWSDDEGHMGLFQLFVLSHIPVNLWGRDMHGSGPYY